MKPIYKIMIYMFFMLIYLLMHEHIHYTLYKYEGYDPHIGLSKGGFYTTISYYPDINPPSKELVLAQYLTDVIGYTLFLPFIVLIVIVFKSGKG